MTEVCQWTVFAICHLVGWDVLTMICCLFVRSFTWRSSLYTASSCWSMRYLGFLFPSNAGTKILGVLSLLSFLLQCPNHSFRSHDHIYSNGTPAWAMPRALVGFTSAFCLLKGYLLLWCPVPHLSFSWPNNIRDSGTVPGGELKFSKAPNRLHKCLNLINHNFWDNVHLTWPNDSKKLYSSV